MKETSTLKIPAELHHRLRIAAVGANIPLGEFVTEKLERSISPKLARRKLANARK